MSSQPFTLHPAGSGRHRARYGWASYARDWRTWQGTRPQPAGRHLPTDAEVEAELAEVRAALAHRTRTRDVISGYVREELVAS